MTNRAPAPKSRSSKSAQTSRDHGNGRSVINCKARLFASSSGSRGGKFQRALVDSEKNKVGTRRRLPAFALEKVLVILFLPPNGRDEGKAPGKNGPR